MKRNVSISVPEDMYEYMANEGRYTSMSEYIRSLVTQDRKRREDDAARPIPSLPQLAEMSVLIEAREQLDKLNKILNRSDIYDD